MPDLPHPLAGKEPMSSVEIYEGRMETDGGGNLLASEEKVRPVGWPIAYDRALSDQRGQPTFIYIEPGERSHNERHHERFAEADWGPNGTRDTISATTSSQDTDDPDLVNVDEDGGINMHHFAALPDDPHYHEGATDHRGVVTNTRAKQLPDALAPYVTGHTNSKLRGSDE